MSLLSNTYKGGGGVTFFPEFNIKYFFKKGMQYQKSECKLYYRAPVCYSGRKRRVEVWALLLLVFLDFFCLFFFGVAFVTYLVYATRFALY